MTDHTMAVPGDPGDDDYEGRARSLLLSMAELRGELERHLREAKAGGAGEGVDLKGMGEVSARVARMLGVVAEAEGKAADVRRIHSGGGGLDLDAARAEIGRRLARLRSAEGEDRVPRRA